MIVCLRSCQTLASKWHLGLSPWCFPKTGSNTAAHRWQQVLGLAYTRDFGSSLCAKDLGTTNREKFASDESTPEGIENVERAEQTDKCPSSVGVSKAIKDHPSQRHKNWTKTDLDLLKSLHDEGYSRAAMAQVLGRSYYAVANRLLRLKKDGHSFNPAMALRKNTTSAHSDLLLQLKASGASWPKIQLALPDYPLDTLRKVWRRHQDISQLSNQRHRGQEWTLAEDSALKEGRTEMKLRFKDIQKQLPGRSIEALRTRYAKIDGSYKQERARPFSLEEMYRMAKLKEDRWTLAEIASELGRSRTSVKNFYNNYLRDGYTIASDGSIQWTEEWKKRHAFRLHRLKLDGSKQETKDNET